MVSFFSFSIVLPLQRYVVTTDRSGEIHVTVQVSAISIRFIYGKLYGLMADDGIWDRTVYYYV